MLTVNLNPFPILETEHLILKRFEKTDAVAMFQLRSNAALMKYICRPLQTSINEAEELINKINELIIKNTGINWAIYLKTEQKIIGSVSFHKIDKENYRGEIGYFLLPNYWQKGIISEAISTVLNFGFNTLQFHSVEAQIDPDNIASERVLNKFKFTKEAYFKENFYFNEQFLDTAVYSLLKTDYNV
jgi:ribosomal-protein-alanine N-acetyltransferase